jgi:chromosome segregation ATPase
MLSMEPNRKYGLSTLGVLVRLPAYASLLVIAGGCATQDQLRQTEASSAEQRYELKSNAAAIAELRAQIKSLRGLESVAAEVKARSDAAKTQSESAEATSREFVDNLIAVREEQRRQLDENGAAFADLRRKNAELDTRLQAQQRLLEHSATALNDAMRRIGAMEAGLQDAARRSAALEARIKTGQEGDDALTRQIAGLGKQIADTRSLINSEGLLQLMRDVEDMRRSSASLRGLLEELQKAQSDSAAQVKNFYIDLDTRLRLLKQNQAQRPAKPDSSPLPPVSVPDTGSTVTPVPLPPPSQ